MIIVILTLNSAAIIAGLIFWIIESRRRFEAERCIFRELKKVLDVADADLKQQQKVLRYCEFLRKRSKFHRYLIDTTIRRLDDQENNFRKFGEFIALIAESIPMHDPEAQSERKKRIEQLKRNFWSNEIP
jgi:hypothetical protein